LKLFQNDFQNSHTAYVYYHSDCSNPNKYSSVSLRWWEENSQARISLVKNVLYICIKTRLSIFLNVVLEKVIIVY
jgi:hypothetical protein